MLDHLHVKTQYVSTNEDENMKYSKLLIFHKICKIDDFYQCFSPRTFCVFQEPFFGKNSLVPRWILRSNKKNYSERSRKYINPKCCGGDIVQKSGFTHRYMLIYTV